MQPPEPPRVMLHLPYRPGNVKDRLAIPRKLECVKWFLAINSPVWPRPHPTSSNRCWKDMVIRICIWNCAAHYWSNYFWRNSIDSIVQMSKGVKRIIFFVRKLHFSCLSKYTVPIFNDRFSELGNTIYHEIFRFAIINLKHGTYESPSSFFLSLCTNLIYLTRSSLLFFKT